MDKQTHIINQATRLPVDSRLVIIKAIQDSIEREQKRIAAVDRIAQLIPIGEEVFDCKYIPFRRYETDTYIRNMCARVMRDEGYTLSAIGRAMGRKTSSVITMARRADDMADGFFGKDIQDKYNAFIKRV